MRGRGIIGVIVIVWLLIGVFFALWQRGYFSNSQTNCATAGSIALTVVAGAAQLRRGQSQGCELQSAAAQSVMAKTVQQVSIWRKQ